MLAHIASGIEESVLSSPTIQVIAAEEIPFDGEVTREHEGVVNDNSIQIVNSQDESLVETIIESHFS